MNTLSRDRDFVLIVSNPKAGWVSRQRSLEQLATLLRQRGLDVQISTDLEHIEQLARQLHALGRLRALVGAGGDGTLAELANRAPAGAPLATYPAGTANLVARYVGATTRMHDFAQMLIDGHTWTCDAGLANGRLFVAVCSAGFDAQVVERVHAARKGHITSLAYLAPIVQAIGQYNFPELKISVEDKQISARWAFISNLPCYGGGIKPGSQACGDDGLLDLCAIRHGGFFRAMQYLPYLLLGRPQDLTDCTLQRSRKIHIECATENVPYQVDGDPGGYLPLTIEVLPRRIRLVVPRRFAELQAATNLAQTRD